MTDDWSSGGYIFILLLLYSISSGALESPDLIQSYCKTTHTITHKHYSNNNTYLHPSFSLTTQVRPRLPLALPNGLRAKLDPRPRPILEYNRYVVATREMQLKAWILCKFGIYCIAWGRQRREKTARKNSIITISRIWYEYINRHRKFKMMGSKNERVRSANVLQKWVRRCNGCKKAQWKKSLLRREYRATALLQRFYRWVYI